MGKSPAMFKSFVRLPEGITQSYWIYIETIDNSSKKKKSKTKQKKNVWLKPQKIGFVIAIIKAFNYTTMNISEYFFSFFRKKIITLP